MQDVPDLVGAREAADILGCSVATVHRHEVEGRLSVAHKVDGLRGPKLFRRSDVVALGDSLSAPGSEVSA